MLDLRAFELDSVALYFDAVRKSCNENSGCRRRFDILRSLLRHTLQKFGYEVVLAESDLKAAEILSQNEGPRLALIDWSAPNFDGPDLCREVRNVRNDGTYVYIILLTSKQGNEDIVAGLEAGADDYLTKPCRPAELRARLSTGCRILSLEENLVKARDEMHYRATHDSLTEIWNRATILSLVRTELELAALEESGRHRWYSAT